ncbi:MAG TPA: DUF4838 domain-containing protein [Fimbriimonadaceae bacterium]
MRSINLVGQVLVGAIALFGCSTKSVAQVEVALSLNGSALLPIVISPNASAETKTDANTLAKYLDSITGGQFQVTTGDGSSGIALGTFSDFNLPDVKNPWNTSDPFQGDNYILRTHPGGVYLIGETPIAAQHAMWDLLRREGYRQYFPGPDWEIVPNKPSFALTSDTSVQPSYAVRQLFIQYGTWPEDVPPLQDWAAKNRESGSFKLTTGEMYVALVARNKAAFAAHPEYLAVEKGRPTNKVVASNPGLVQLVIDDAMRQIAANPKIDTISVEPSDGAGWGDDPAIPNPSDRVVTIANAVADALHAKYGNRYYVTFLAYMTHSKPPTIKVHPGIIVSVTDGYNESGLSLQDLIAAWKNMGAIVGLYQYESIFQWDSDMPACSRASSIPYSINLLTNSYNSGVRLTYAEAQMDWARSGLGYYMQSLFLWDINVTKYADQNQTEFMNNCFKSAAGPMAKFYGEIMSSFTDTALPKANVTLSQIQAMYHDLDDAEAQAGGDPKVIKRIDDLTAYCRYLELYYNLKMAKAHQRTAPLEALMNFCWRTRTLNMVHTAAVYQSVQNLKGDATIPAGVSWSAPASQDPWKQGPQITPQELAGYRHR